MREKKLLKTNFLNVNILHNNQEIKLSRGVHLVIYENYGGYSFLEMCIVSTVGNYTEGSLKIYPLIGSVHQSISQTKVDSIRYSRTSLYAHSLFIIQIAADDYDKIS